LVGGGNSAAQASMHFSAVARKVTMIVRDDALKQTVSAYLVDRIYSANSVAVLTNTEVIALIGERFLEAIR
jgi:thioredoxin reductase (NADPH)